MSILKVLIIEDDPDHSKTVVDILKNKATSSSHSLGEIEFFQAPTIDDAITGFTRLRPELAIVDVRLDSDSEAGFKFIESTKKIYPDCSFLIMTGFPGERTAERAAKTGVTHLLIKPYDPQLLIRTVFSLLETAQSSLPNQV
jgi:DNA-binding NtrC family response regulator